MLLIDVREDEEWAGARIPGAVHVPLGRLEEDALAEALDGEITPEDRQREVVVYCAAGVRSLVGAAAMREMGFDRAVSLAGGIKGWADSGGAVER